jgi:uncharacterized CHY-type Zn-finger protein
MKRIISLLGVGAFEFSLFSQVENEVVALGFTYDNLYACFECFSRFRTVEFESSVLGC